MKRLCILAFAFIIGCDEPIAPEYPIRVSWCKLPYTKGNPNPDFMGKSYYDQEVYLSEQGIVCPFSIVHGDSDGKSDPHTHLLVSFHDGRSTIWWRTPQKGALIALHTARESEREWFRITCDWRDNSSSNLEACPVVERITNDEFSMCVTNGSVNATRVIEVNGNRLIVGGYGFLRGYEMTGVVDRRYYSAKPTMTCE